MTEESCVSTVVTPDGLFTIVADQWAVLASGWTTPAVLLARLRIDAPAYPGGTEADFLAAQAIAVVNAYYAGSLAAPETIPTRQTTASFHHRVREALHATHPGDRLTYTQLATRAGNPHAFRAAASACARNLTALFVPCHRVIRSDGTLGGFWYGLPLKQSLLDREGASPT